MTETKAWAVVSSETKEIYFLSLADNESQAWYEYCDWCGVNWHRDLKLSHRKVDPVPVREDENETS